MPLPACLAERCCGLSLPLLLQVFPSPQRALALYIQRVFEQKVQTAVDAVLRTPQPDAPPPVLRAALRTLGEAYRKTRALADDLQASGESFMFFPGCLGV